jgi:hypothetical protein
MLNFADDNGILPASAKMVKASIFPMDAIPLAEITALTDSLEEVGLIVRYEAVGKVYWQIDGFHEHNTIKNPSYKYPPMGESSPPCTSRKGTRTAPDGTRPPLIEDKLSKGKEKGSTEGAGAPAAAPPPTPPAKPKRQKEPDPDTGAMPFPPALDTPACRQAAAEWVVHRRGKKEPVTELQLEKTLKRFEPLGAARFVAAIDFTISNGWQGLREPDPPRNGIRAGPDPKPDDPGLRGFLDDAAARDERLRLEREARKQAAN